MTGVSFKAVSISKKPNAQHIAFFGGECLYVVYLLCQKVIVL